MSSLSLSGSIRKNSENLKEIPKCKCLRKSKLTVHSGNTSYILRTDSKAAEVQHDVPVKKV